MDLMNSLDADGNEKGGSNPPADLAKGTGQGGRKGGEVYSSLCRPAVVKFTVRFGYRI